VDFLVPAGRRAVVSREGETLIASMLERRDEAWVRRPAAGVTAAARRVLELAVPLSELRANPDGSSELRFFVTLRDAAAAEIERHPHSPVVAEIPGAAFESHHWRV
jgi:hypothetical protein